MNPVASDRLESFFSPSGFSEAYLCFENSDLRNAWVGAIKVALDAESARERLGYSVANGAASKLSSESSSTSVDSSGDDSARKENLEARLPDGDSLRSSLQRVSDGLISDQTKFRSRFLILFPLS